jgi:hypothetical protein
VEVVAQWVLLVLQVVEEEVAVPADLFSCQVIQSHQVEQLLSQWVVVEQTIHQLALVHQVHIKDKIQYLQVHLVQE